MMNEEIVGVDLVHHVAVVDGEILEARVGGLDDDLGSKPGTAKHALNAEHLVADGVTVAERGEDLMDAGRRESRAAVTEHRTAPRGRHDLLGRTFGSGAGGRTSRAAAPCGGAGSRFSRSNISRYFRSITGHV